MCVRFPHAHKCLNLKYVNQNYEERIAHSQQKVGVPRVHENYCRRARPRGEYEFVLPLIISRSERESHVLSDRERVRTLGCR